jgi:hypothetical protein
MQTKCVLVPCTILQPLCVIRIALTLTSQTDPSFFVTISCADRFIAERLVRAASVLGRCPASSRAPCHTHARYFAGLPVTIIRPGTIIGHTKTGAANATDYAPSIIAAFARMGSYVNSHGSFDLNPADMVARASVLLSLQPVSQSLRVFHLVYAGKASYQQVGRAAAGSAGRELSFAEFKADMIGRLNSGVSANGAESLRSFVSFFETDSFFSVQAAYRSETTVAVLRQLGFDWNCDSIACVKGVVSFLQKCSTEA